MWRVGAAWSNHDVRPAKDARPWVKRWIRRKFVQYQRRNDGRRIVEKTPTNVARVAFIREIFPDAQIIHIIRDGRAVVCSRLRRWKAAQLYNIGSAETRRHILNRMSLVPFWEWPAYSWTAAREVCRRYVTHKPAHWWGLKYPGWAQDRSELTVAQLAARQWVFGVEAARGELGIEDVAHEHLLEVKYEDLTSDFRRIFGGILRFVGVDGQGYADQVATTVRTDSVDRWRRELPESVLAEIMPCLEPALRQLGYAIEHGSHP